jgi:hypothetical protein
MVPNQEKPHTTPYRSLIYISTYHWDFLAEILVTAAAASAAEMWRGRGADAAAEAAEQRAPAGGHSQHVCRVREADRDGAERGNERQVGGKIIITL